MVDLMRSRPAPVLPASLRVLRQDNVEDINTLPQNKWKKPLATVVLPVLEWRCEWLRFGYIDGNNEQPDGPAADVANLPLSFRALWVQTNYICIPVAEHSGGAVLDHDDQADDVVAAEELCRFFGLAPDCYEEFRLLTNPGQPMLELTAAYLLARSDTRNMIDYPGVDLEELAADMQWYASAHGLSVSLSNDETYLQVVRVRHQSVQRV